MGLPSTDAFGPRQTAIGVLWSNFEYLEEDIVKERPELSKIEVSRNTFYFPPSRLMTLRKDGTEIQVIVRRDRFPILYELIENYHKGLRLVSREEKYKNFYQVYEELSKESDVELKAIRHSLSHSRRKLTDKKTIATLISMFGDVKINLAKHRHAQIFKRNLQRLRQESHRLLVEEILKIVPDKPNFYGAFYMP